LQGHDGRILSQRTLTFVCAWRENSAKCFCLHHRR